MLSGTDWIPTEWREVQDYNCLIQMTELLMADNKKEVTKKEVAEAKTQNNQWNATPIGKMRFIKSSSAPNGKNGVSNNREVADYTWANYIHKDFSAPKYICTISSIKKNCVNT